MAKKGELGYLGNMVRGLLNFFTFGLIKPLHPQGGDRVIDVIDNVVKKYTGSGTTTADTQAWEMNEQSAENQRQWESEEALKAYERQREFYHDFQSPQAMIQQYQQAGINPALMYGHGVQMASPVSGNQASGGASGSAPSPQSGDIGQLISLLANVAFRAKEVNAETKLKGAQSRLINAQANIQENEDRVWGERFDFWKQLQSKNLSEIDSKIFLNNAQGALAHQGISESEARVTLLNYQSAVEASNAKYADRMNESLLRLRESARQLNEANRDYATSQSEESKQRLLEAQQSWGSRWRTLQETARKASAEAGMSESEAAAFWTDKRLNELLVLSEIFDNYQQTTKIGPFSLEQTSLRNGIDRVFPSLYEH